MSESFIQAKREDGKRKKTDDDHIKGTTSAFSALKYVMFSDVCQFTQLSGDEGRRKTSRDNRLSSFFENGKLWKHVEERAVGRRPGGRGSVWISR